MSKEDKLEKLAKFVNEVEERVSVSDIAEELDISHSYAYSLAMEAMDEGRIDGDQSTPVIGYLFESKSDTDENELEVLTSREGLLWAVKEYAPDRLSEARSRDSLDSLRRFVRQKVAEGTVPVNRAWRLYPA